MKGGGGHGGGGAGGGGGGGGTPNNLPGPGGYQSAPLSSRKAQALDMSTVERRSSSSKENPKRIRPHGLLEAPTYRPTPEQFKDPFEYIKSIAEEGKKYGIIKIIPPDTWNPEFAVDTERFHFRTRRQELNSVEGGNFNPQAPNDCTRANLNYLDQLSKYHKQHGTNLNRFPSVDKRPLDLYRLKKAVEIRGGFSNVCKHKKWAEIGRDLGYSGKIMSSLSTSLKNSYQRYLHPYEEWVKSAKPGVQQQIEAEQGGPITPSGSPLKKLPADKPAMSPLSSLPDSPAIRASTALNASVVGTPDKSDTDMADATPIRGSTPAVNGGFTAVNSGSGFTPVNSGAGGFTPVNVSNGMKRELDANMTPNTGNSRRSENGATPSKRSTPELKAGTILKRGHSQENGSGVDIKEQSKEATADESENGERRSKRLKKEPAPMVAGSHMTLHRPSSTPRTLGGDRNNSSKPGEKCEKCGRGDDMANLLLCESCDHGYHTFCLEPVLKSVPDRDWYCDRCLVGTGDYGFADGEIYSLRQFQEKANNFKDLYFQSKMPFDPVLNKPRQVTEDDVEREFWKLVESVHETVEVEYGADIHSTTHGSGFPTIEKQPTYPYATDPWNLNNLPLHPESLFRHIKSDVSGMTVPWLYVGMCFSTFCWHNEDHYTYSANYQHFGATKTWYGIPGSDAMKFEDAMREAVPELFEQQPDLLFQLVTLLTPQHLMKAGVKVYALDQRAGQFVVTFPQAYHAGFNHGFNFNEAVNFAPSDWEPFGQAGVERYLEFRKAPVFSHDELLLTAAARDTTIKTSQWLAPALARVKDRELQARRGLLEHLPDIKQAILPEDEELSEDQYQCGVCKVYCYLSQITCPCTPNVTCPSHFRDICDCEVTSLSLRLRMTDESLEELVQRVHDKANMPKAWAVKLEKSIAENPQPALKVLKSLLSEGERIPCYIPELAPLKAFVERAQEWVDEATPFISRKQQNRRKNEKAWRRMGSKVAEMEEKEREQKEREHRKLDSILKLLERAEDIGFECPEIEQLRERADLIRAFQLRARTALATPGTLSTPMYEELVETGKSFNVDLAETDLLEKIVRQLKWADSARDARARFLSLTEVAELIKSGQELGIPDSNEQMMHFRSQKEAGDMWEKKAKELMSVEIVHFQQLEALSGQASTLPVSRETLAQVDQILNKQREAHRQIVALYEKSKEADFYKRPKYKEVRDVLDGLTELHSKPTGTIDLEKEQKRHEDWMRRGKKLFGKANAPLHILAQHMAYVEGRNKHCFCLEDRPRTPVEPSSREPSPDSKSNGPFGEGSRGGRPREVFCICRQPEAGMMIECEVCHEWYHGKCLKIARGKVKEDEKYTCPICDYRVKIPRDAARPKLEELIDWQAEIENLPFIPDELDCLRRIIDAATKFREWVRPLTNAIGLTGAEVPTMRFYLRKIEGAEILLSPETNFFRTELHKWMPIAPDPPPVVEVSMSTRKPRPTKQQKLMAQMGITNPDDLPPQLRTKAHSFSKKKPAETNGKPPPPIKPAPSKGSMTSSPVTPTSQTHPLLGQSSSSSSSQPPPSQPQFDYPRFGSTGPSAQSSPTFTLAHASSNSNSGNGTSSSSQHQRLGSPVLMNNPGRGQTLDPALFNPQAFSGDHNGHGPRGVGGGPGSPQYTSNAMFELTREDSPGVTYESLAVEALNNVMSGEALDEKLADQFLAP
ncbi:PLU-1-like protein-domain-containing protein [Tuber borchii]|uniref:PLU-1-like protein-domain-containing protein n=1 Tax=Tuber borchii TaxID=42251 RepID=A0A2T6ZQA8_TUBBO|nr:PLU-1-like protein-domain-containing protein [Tuber borchii]